MNKRISQISSHSFRPAFPGLMGIDIMAHVYPIEPILVFTEYHMNQAVFGPHPHAGISVMTYMLPDSEQGFINRDSLGDMSYIEPGGLHITQAGSGMFHDEFPRVAGIDTHGFQIWFNHAESNRWVEPKSMHAAAAEIPEKVGEGYRVRVLHGNFEEVQALHQMVVAINLLHIELEAGQTLELPAREMAFVYTLAGDGRVNDQAVTAHQLVNFTEEGNRIQLQAGDSTLALMFATATPTREPIVYGGPFVMTTQAQMRATQERLQNGGMGYLGSYKG